MYPLYHWQNCYQELRFTTSIDRQYLEDCIIEESIYIHPATDLLVLGEKALNNHGWIHRILT
jgi:hypothetical protein